MFSWFDALHLHNYIKILKNTMHEASLVPPKWVYFSLPNALWTFGGIFLFTSIWKEISKGYLLWIFIFSMIAICSELGQLSRIIPGTFDINDLLLIIVSIVLAMVIIYKNLLLMDKKNEKNK
jgi:hypothetical protein